MAAKLQCEICGGKLIGKPGGIFECDSCGVEYSTEWAKMKIQEIRGTVTVEGTVEVTGKVQVEGPIKVENGGPSAESLVKRGMQQLEKETQFQRLEAEDFFLRALEINPESGDAFWGLYLLGQDCRNLSEAVEKAPDWAVLDDYSGNYLKAKKYACGQTAQDIETLEKQFASADQSEMLPSSLKELFVVRNGTLFRKDPGNFDRSLGRDVFKGDDLTHVHIPEGVEKLGASVFSSCTLLTSVIIPDTVTEIGSHAFSNCDKLTTIQLPRNLKTIGNSAFSYCRNLTSVIIPDSVVSIEPCVFSGCKSLSSITLSNNLEELPANVFQGCDSLEELIIPDSVKRAYVDFDSCKKLKKVVLPDEIEWISFRIRFLGGKFHVRIGSKAEALCKDRGYAYCQLKTPETFTVA